ncbi:MAG: glycosyltransferase [Planctomycetales bacterium]|nr:glycosyltransferase [Planctomycetales bacterium]
MAIDDLTQLTAIIPTRGNPKPLKRLQKSLQRSYPDLKVVVADDGMDSSTVSKGSSIRLPVGVGRAAACNAMLARLRTPYFLLLDEQCEIGKETELRQLLQMVATDSLDIAAGDIVGCQKRFWFFVRQSPQPGHGILELAGSKLTLRPGHRSAGEGFYWCDFVSSFFVARTEKVRAMGGWDPELKNDEREEFFLRAHRQGLRVGIVPEVTVRYWNDESPSPSTDQVPDLKSLAVAKMRLASMTQLDGQLIKAPRRLQAA